MRAEHLTIARTLVDFAGGTNKFWFFPLYGMEPPWWTRPSETPYYNNPDIPFAKHFANPQSTTPSTGYLLPFIVIDRNVHPPVAGGSLAWDWSHSGNPDGPWFPSDSSAIAVVDLNSFVTQPTTAGNAWKKSYCTAHNGCGFPFKESNSLWGNGHAETRTTPQNHYLRLGVYSLHPY